MKKWIGGSVFFILALLSSYYGFGIVTERVVKKNIVALNQSGGLSVELQKYQRGFYQSTAMLNVRTYVPEHSFTNDQAQSIHVPAQDYTLEIPLTIYHGPIIFGPKQFFFGVGYAESDVKLPPVHEATFNRLYTATSTKPHLNLSLLMSYLGRTTLYVSIPQFTAIAKQGGAEFDWHGFRSKVHFNPSNNTLKGHAILDGVNWLNTGIDTTLNELHLDYKLHQSEAGLYVGDVTFKSPSIHVTAGKQVIFSLEHFVINSMTDSEDGLLSSHFQSSFDKYIDHDKTYGPIFLALSIKNLDELIFIRMNEQITALRQGTSQRARQQTLFSLLPELPSLLGRGAQFEVSDLHVGLPNGLVRGNLLITLPNESSTNPFQLMEKIEGHSYLDISKVVLSDVIAHSLKRKIQAAQALQPSGTATQSVSAIEKQASQEAEEKIAALVQTGLLAVEGDSYTITLKLQKGKLMVNEKPFNQTMMQF